MTRLRRRRGLVAGTARTARFGISLILILAGCAKADTKSAALESGSSAATVPASIPAEDVWAGVELVVDAPHDFRLTSAPVVFPLTVTNDIGGWDDSDLVVIGVGAVSVERVTAIPPHHEGPTFDGEIALEFLPGTVDELAESTIHIELTMGNGYEGELTLVTIADEERVFVSYSPRIARQLWMGARLAEGEISQREYDDFIALLANTQMPPGTWRPGDPWAVER